MNCSICGIDMDIDKIPLFVKKYKEAKKVKYQLITTVENESVKKEAICSECVARLKSLRYRPELNITDEGDKVLTIPSGATNGDVLEAVFPKAKVWSLFDTQMIAIQGEDYPSSFLISWWDALYKREVEE